MFPTINLGPLSLPAPEFILLISLWLGSMLSERYARQSNVDPLIIEKVLLLSLLTGIVGGRLSYVFRSPSAFGDNILSIFSLNPNLIDPAGGLFVSLAVGYLYLSKQKISFKAILDSLSPFFAVTALALSIANYASGKGFGIATTLPWGIELWGAIRHPVQLYFLVCGVITLLFLLWFYKTKAHEPGTVFFVFLSITSGYRLFFSGFQETGLITTSGIRLSQIAAWLILVFSIYLLKKPFFPTREDKNHAP
ncbi:MAG: prolipoprotein diacylglyceryl transferase [Anaerolineales bacterium]|nr:prolipoprotein diacylglyceryl transferase [Anaerolineales bacterium]